MSLPELAVSYVRSIPAATFDAFLESVAMEKLDLRIEPRDEEGPYAGVEWLLPTAVILFLGKAYFETFLKEMGKDHYHLLKAGLRTLRDKLLGSSKPRLTVIATPGKAAQEPKYSIVFSILAEAGPRLRFKLLFPPELTEVAYDATIDAFLSFLVAYHDRDLEPEMLEKLAAARVIGGTVLLVYDLHLETLVVIDPVSIRERQE